MASVKRMERDGTPFWRVRWREGGKGRRGRSRQRDWSREGLAKEHLRKVTELEDRRSGGLSHGDGTWPLERFYTDKFLPVRGARVTAGTRGSWERRWAPSKTKPQVWHVGRAWGGVSLEDITFEDVDAWHAQMKRAGASDATMYRAHDLLVNVLNYALRLRYVPVNEALGCRPAYRPRRIVGVWQPGTIETIRTVLNARAREDRTRNLRWRRDRDAVLVAVLGYAGLRPGEALALTWRNLLPNHLWVTHTIPGVEDEAEAEADIENGRTKTGGDRVVPFDQAPFLRRLLLEWKLRVGPHTEDSPIFPSCEGGDQPWSYAAWISWRRGVWAKVLAQAGVEYRKPYHLRHSCVSMWIYAGLPIPEVARRAGHTVKVCSDTYTHAFETYDHARPLNIDAAFRAAQAPSNVRRLRAV